MLTEAKLRTLKPEDKLVKITDRDGLYIAVAPSGLITFRYNYRINGRQETLTLGRYQGLATNAISNTSEIGQAIALRSGTFSLTYFIKGDEVICSLRSLPPFDVSVIATYFGGGGHAQASGFTLPIDRFFREVWQR